MVDHSAILVCDQAEVEIDLSSGSERAGARLEARHKVQSQNQSLQAHTAWSVELRQLAPAAWCDMSPCLCCRIVSFSGGFIVLIATCGQVLQATQELELSTVYLLGFRVWGRGI